MNLVYRVCPCDAMKRLTLGVSIVFAFWGNCLSALAEEPRFVDHSLLIASEYLDMWHHTHLMDSTAGSHLVPPSFALPNEEQHPAYAPEVRGWLQEYEQKYGSRGASADDYGKCAVELDCGTASNHRRSFFSRNHSSEVVARVAGDHTCSY